MRTVNYRVETSYPWQKNNYRWLPEHEKITLKRAKEVVEKYKHSAAKVRVIRTTVTESIVNL